MRFRQIACIDDVGLIDAAYTELQSLSEEPLRRFDGDPADAAETAARMKGADAVLVSWRTPITAQLLAEASGLRYVGMCCSLYDEATANVDIVAARARGIEVLGVRDYGDRGVAEFVLAELIRLIKGLGNELQWQAEPRELASLRLGVVGLGTTGRLVADAARCLSTTVSYFSRTRKRDAEEAGIAYRTLPELLAWSHVVSTHLPPNTALLGHGELARMGPGTILVNTSLGPTFDVDAFLEWIALGERFAIFDGDAIGDLGERFAGVSGIVARERVAGFTAEARRRLSQKVLSNLRSVAGAV